jgi:phosphoglycerol transferase
MLYFLKGKTEAGYQCFLSRMSQKVNEQNTPPDRGADLVPTAGRTSKINIRTFIPSFGVRILFEYAVLTVSVLVAFMWAYQWNIGDSLSVPLGTLSGDGLISLFVVKALGEGQLLENRSLGAPFGLPYYDFHQPDFVHEGLTKLLVAVTGDPMLALNLFYILGFVLIAFAAYFVLRHLSISRLVAGGCAILYAFLPYHMLRSFDHLFLSAYWIAPLTSLLALKIMAGPQVDRISALSAKTDLDPVKCRDGNEWRRILWWALPLSVVIGGSGVYYSFFSVLFLAVSGVYSFFIHRTRRYALVAALCIATVVASTTAGMVPTWIYNAATGPNLSVAARDAYETDIYSLKIAHLLLPSAAHRIGLLRSLTARYESPAPALNGNESRFAALGFVGSAGFLVLLLNVFSRFRRPLLYQLGLLNLAGLLFATTAGFGALFSLLISPQLRAQNRIAVFLSFFAITAVAVCLEKLRRVVIIVEFSLPHSSWRRSLPDLVVSAAMFAIVILGLYDQVPGQLSWSRPASTISYNAQRAFIAGIEQRLPKGAAILQLPNEFFPEGPPVNNMEAYDHLRGYVFSSHLKWSFPAMRGREGDDLIRDISSEPGVELVKDARALGFRGIYVDRWGYSDQGAGIEGQLQPLLGMPSLVSSDRRIAFYSMVNSSAPASVSSKAGSRSFPISFLSGFYGRESSGGREWRWCDKQGRLIVYNLGNGRRKANFTMQAFSAFESPSKLSIQTPSGTRQFQISAAGAAISFDLVLEAGANRFLLSTDAPRVVTGSGDPRELHFRVEHFDVKPE